MNKFDFDNDDFDNDVFDKRFDSMWRMSLTMLAISSVIGLGLVGFFVWGVIQVLGHFGII